MQWVECLEARTKSFRRRREKKTTTTNEYNGPLNKDKRTACNLHVPCDLISVEINCCFNLVFATDKSWRAGETFGDRYARCVQLYFRALVFPAEIAGGKKGKRRHEISWKSSHWDRHSDMIAGILQTAVIFWPTFEQGHGDAILLPSL